MLRTAGTAGRVGGRRLNGILSPCELRVFKLVCEGLSNKKAAERLYVCEKTVKFHLTRIYKKLKVKSRTEAVSKYFNRELDSDLIKQINEVKFARTCEALQLVPEPKNDEPYDLPMGLSVA